MKLKPEVKKILSVAVALIIVALVLFSAQRIVNGEKAQTNEIISVKNSVAGLEAKLNAPTATPEATLVPTKAQVKTFAPVKVAPTK